MIRNVLPMLALAALASSPVCGEQNAKPNIVFILADDMGFGDPGCYNPDSKIPTPNIDRLAAEGIRFIDAHAPGALCVPSRYGLLTGRYPMRATLRPARQACIEDGRMTLASLLRRNGYRTAMIGKWHLGFDNRPDDDWTKPLTGGPVDRGFDSFFGIPSSLDIPPYYFIRDRTAVEPPTENIAASSTDGWTPIQGAFWREGRIAPGFDHAEVLPVLGREAASVIDDHANDDCPLFLYVALTAPHTPWLPSSGNQSRSDAGMYGDFVTQVDDTVGQILEALDRNEIKDDTLVCFSSDNGPVWYTDDEQRFGHESTGPYRGMKADAWEGGHRVPFVARWPGHIPAGTTSDQTLCFTDMLATFAALVKDILPVDAGEDSFNMLPAFRGDELEEQIRQATVLKQSATAIRSGRWKLITHLGSGGFSNPRRRDAEAGEPEGQLYDLQADPGESQNLWDEEPDIVARLTDLLQRQKNQDRTAPRSDRPNFIVILADDMGYGDSSVFDGWLRTPHFERMAAEGIRFTDFHSSGTVCSPTRAGLLTGRYQQRAGIPGVINADPQHPDHNRGLQPAEVTFAELLSDAGYHTGVFGKWHLGYLPQFNPIHHGFDQFRGFLSGNIDYISHFDRMGTYDWWDGQQKVDEPGYLTHLITEHTLQFIADHRHEPFCVYVSHGAMHAPIQAPNSAPVRGPDVGKSDAPDRSRAETIRLMMQALDESVGAILDAVEENGVASKTFVVFLSDNGGAAHMRNEPLRGGKGTVFEGGHRVPAIGWWPGRIQPASTSNALCISLDIMPTMLDLAGIEPPPGLPLDGISLRPILFGEGQKGPRELFWNGKAMREGRWKLIAGAEGHLLFDLESDLSEQDNIASEHPERVRKMLEAIERWKIDVNQSVSDQTW